MLRMHGGLLGRAGNFPTLRIVEGVRKRPLPSPLAGGVGDGSLAVYGLEAATLGVSEDSDSCSRSSLRRHVSCRRQPNLLMPIWRRSPSERVWSTAPEIAFSRNVATTSASNPVDDAHKATSCAVHSFSLAGSCLKRVPGLSGPEIRHVLAVPWRWSSAVLGSAVPPVLPTAGGTGVSGGTGLSGASESSALLPLPTKTQSLLYLSQMLERPRLVSSLLLPAEPVESL